ncbi:MAG: UDP-N-acetyl glucosamine 2-epimerase [candidate division Zixibacteria bacterium]|nr:UDP-N-acetyl glucosamine 2-epimerase [candidate division Zixibacteria bacterium]
MGRQTTVTPRQAGRARPVVVTVFGTRPQFIKLSVLWRPLERHFRSILIDSGQHYDFALAASFHEEIGLRRPDYHLGVGSAPAAAQIGRLADALDGRLGRLRPQGVIVVGDTSTTAGAAIAAAYRGIPLAHVEAGLRSFDRSAPEEKNRVLADHLATWRFCPNRAAMTHLHNEGITDGVIGSGDVLYENWLRWTPTDRRPLGIARREYYFVTCHRAENVDDPDCLRRLVDILCALNRITVFAVHPRAEKNLRRLHLWSPLEQTRHLRLTAPLPHRPSLVLIANARSVLTDSGGVQREAYWSRTPCVVLREATEWRELIDCGAGVLTGLNGDRVRRALAGRGGGRRADDRVFGIRKPAKRVASRLARELIHL